jgi:hypothetical protein
VHSRLETYKREQILEMLLIEKKEKNKVFQCETYHFHFFINPKVQNLQKKATLVNIFYLNKIEKNPSSAIPVAKLTISAFQ